MIQEILKALSGNKTYMVAALMGLASFAFAAGMIDQATFIAIQGVLFPGGLAALRAGVEKGGRK